MFLGNHCKFQWFWRDHCKFSMVFEETITIECFLAVWPLPSMVFRWFFIFLPSLSMVFDGSGPLVKRCDGFDGSLWSISHYSTAAQYCKKGKTYKTMLTNLGEVRPHLFGLSVTLTTILPARSHQPPNNLKWRRINSKELNLPPTLQCSHASSSQLFIHYIFQPSVF